MRREGTDVTIIATLLMMHRSMLAAEKLAAHGISAEVIDPRSLVPFDWETVSKSIKKTGHVMSVEESPKHAGIGAEIMAHIAEEYFNDLQAPVKRVAPPSVVVPFSPPMEKFYLPQVDDIVSAATEMLSNRKEPSQALD